MTSLPLGISMSLRGVFLFPALFALAAFGASQQDSDTVPGTSPEGFTGIGVEETIYFGGTEPFWGGEVADRQMLYTTPENADGVRFAVERFTGQGGLGFSGTMEGAPVDMTVTPGECSDGMSDRVYPYTVTLQIGAEQRVGCAHTDRQPFTGREAP
ncbi:COG3650 family protein [Altererythrobacter sp. MTPC7]|uniref:COG3650 family protein n=1 Tax=Altererythrobacter sp. MTPC7 TaxID=3056567 RepID=UPI0036F1DD08